MDRKGRRRRRKIPWRRDVKAIKAHLAFLDAFGICQQSLVFFILPGVEVMLDDGVERVREWALAAIFLKVE